MTYGTRTDHYPATSKLLHWLVAICVLTTAPVAITMTRVAKGPTQDILYNFHKSLGVLILILMILRLINRLAVGALTADPGHRALAEDRFLGRAYLALCAAARHANRRAHRQLRLRCADAVLRVVQSAADCR